MAITIKHAKTDTIADWTQADLDQQIAAGNYPPGTTLANIVLPSDWNNDHTFSGVAASGANSDITSLSGITGGISTPTYVQFNTSAAESIGLGKFRWNTTTATASFGIVDGTDEVNIGEQLFAYVTNADSVTITRGQPVYLFGATGNRASVKLASNLSDATSAKTLGLVAQDSIAPNATGFVISQGQLSKLDTSAFNPGDTIYLGATAGTLTATKPKAPNHLVYIGVVERANAGNGQMYVRAQNGYELDEIHDVQITSPTTGQTIVWDNATSLWKNSNAVIMNGGSVDNSPIGATTASTGKFTSVTTPSVTASSTDLTLSAISTGAVLFNTLNGTQFKVTDNGGSAVNFWQATGASTTNWALLNATGSDTNVSGAIVSKGTGSLIFSTNSASGNNQMRVTHTASAVNYVQVTGNVTGTGTNSAPIISAQGSDAAIGLSLTTKGGESIFLRTNSSTRTGFEVGHGGGTVNWLKVIGSVAGNATPLFAQGTDTNISMAFQPKGTGAIDLAAGSSGVNLSNGGTVTAITRTAAGSGYTSVPSVAITAPTTAGGVQATATCQLGLVTVAITNGGTGYTVGDVLTVTGGTYTIQQTFTVTSVSGGVITGVSGNGASYSVLPSNPVLVTGGTGSGATFTITWGLAANSTFTITNAGSGYIEQPTVTFSGGGGSGAAAYAQVGGTPIVRSLNGVMSIYTVNPIGEAFRIQDYPASTTTGYWTVYGPNSSPQLRAVGAGSGVIGTNSAVPIVFQTNQASAGATQFQISHTASAVNYVQVTGSATGQPPAITAQGSDSNVNMTLRSKGTGYIGFTSGGGSGILLGLPNGSANYFTAASSNAGSAPILATAGSDTNIDLALTPKGTGRVKFGTYTVSAGLVTTGYVEILDSGGTLRRLAVV